MSSYLERSNQGLASSFEAPDSFLLFRIDRYHPHVLHALADRVGVLWKLGHLVQPGSGIAHIGQISSIPPHKQAATPLPRRQDPGFQATQPPPLADWREELASPLWLPHASGPSKGVQTYFIVLVTVHLSPALGGLKAWPDFPPPPLAPPPAPPRRPSRRGKEDPGIAMASWPPEQPFVASTSHSKDIHTSLRDPSEYHAISSTAGPDGLELLLEETEQEHPCSAAWKTAPFLTGEELHPRRDQFGIIIITNSSRRQHTRGEIHMHQRVLRRVRFCTFLLFLAR